MSMPAFDDTRAIVRRLGNDGLSTEQRIDLTLERIGRLNPRINALQEVLAQRARRRAGRIERV